MDFDFLPKLPKSNLDDRTFKDLVEECILRIPRYCPEWTNHNPGDPGITLIELFAWLTDQMLMRFNQVPRRNYVAFLELLGIRLKPPTPARCELTFYLVKAQPDAVRIPFATEVATVRTETEEAVIFTTERELVIGNPQIKHLLMANIEERIPYALSDRTPIDGQWWNMEEILLFSRPGNCFYLVLEDLENPIAGNVLAVTFRGEVATTTGIDPNNPPRKWEAWNGHSWQPVLRVKEDDKTKGFSFSELGQQGPNPVQDGADVVLHLPQSWPNESFGTEYNGHWLRCTYTYPEEAQRSYSSSPSIVGVAVRAIGGAVNASQCVRVERELLGVSNGKAGQTFDLQNKPILERLRNQDEYIQLVLSEEETEDWEERPDFAESGPEDKHYTIDSRDGTVQFGPLVREPSQIKQFTLQRGQLQPGGRIVRREANGGVDNLATYIPPEALDPERQALERQYGKVPPPGAEIYMLAYRTGGGSRGNVKAEKLTFLKTSIPYVKSVINYHDARDGSDAESLDEAVIRVPELLRTRECAVIPEDFERVVKKASPAIARAHCLRDDSTAGIVRLLIVPKSDTDSIDFRQGMNPDKYFSLPYERRTEIHDYLSERKPLGVLVKLDEPEYVGVSVRAEVVLEPRYNTPRAQEDMRTKLLITLYRFLNPLTGGFAGQGWELGSPVYSSDIIAVSQKVPGVRYVGRVDLFELRKYDQGWLCSDTPESEIDPGSLGLVCSWEDESQLPSGHTIEFL